MNDAQLDTHHKALEVNLDSGKYGTFAEIGAGQEVARWFFKVGAAAGSVAKTISAYDMNVSDAIYGSSKRYVSRERLRTMLDYEYTLLRERLNEKRGAHTCFFSFADTVKARSYTTLDESHGWMGIRFQHEPRAEPSEVIIHLRMLDRENLQQQEAIGVVGVNLIHAALYRVEDPRLVILSLMDGVHRERIEIDMIKFAGPAFPNVDNRLMSLELVHRGLADAALFTASGEVVQPGEVLYKRPILVERGSFRPITNVTVNMLECARAQFIQEPTVDEEEIVVLMEMTMRNLRTEDGVNQRDFLERVDILGTLGQTVMISNYGRYYRLAAYLFRYTKRMVGLVMGVPSLRDIFEEKYYTDLEGGILESFGRMFKNALKLYVYPCSETSNGAIITAQNLRVAPHLRHLHAYLLENHLIEPIRGFDRDLLPIRSADVLSRILKQDSSWESMVPSEVARIIKERSLLGIGSI